MFFPYEKMVDVISVIFDRLLDRVEQDVRAITIRCIDYYLCTL